MQSKPLTYVKELDVLRFFAVSSVMLSHWSLDISKLSFLSPVASYLANCGVNLFFVLSGFLITKILLVNKNQKNKRFTLRQFYIRRFLRIFPLYYLVLIICVIFNVPEARSYGGWLFTYTSNIIIALKPGTIGYMAPFWSLSVEEQFYIFFPFLILFVNNRYHKKLFLFLILVALISRAFAYFLFSDLNVAGWVSYAFTNCCFDCFAIGAFLATYSLYFEEYLKKLLKHNFLFILIGLGGSLALYFFAVHNKLILPAMIFTRFLFACFCFWLIGNAALGNFTGLFGKILYNRVLIYLGKISYGLYVYHFFMTYIFGYFDFPYKSYLYPIVTIGIAALSWHLYESPINNIKKYINYKKTQVKNPGVRLAVESSTVSNLER